MTQPGQSIAAVPAFVSRMFASFFWRIGFEISGNLSE